MDESGKSKQENEQTTTVTVTRSRLSRHSRTFSGKLKFVLCILLLTAAIFASIIVVRSSQQNNTVHAQDITITPTSSPTDAPTDTPEPSVLPTKGKVQSVHSVQHIANLTPTVDCVGPDGKHLFVTQQQCTSFNRAWTTPTLTPTSTPSVTPTLSLTTTPTPTNHITPTPGS